MNVFLTALFFRGYKKYWLAGNNIFQKRLVVSWFLFIFWGSHLNIYNFYFPVKIKQKITNYIWFIFTEKITFETGTSVQRNICWLGVQFWGYHRDGSLFWRYQWRIHRQNGGRCEGQRVLRRRLGVRQVYVEDPRNDLCFLRQCHRKTGVTNWRSIREIISSSCYQIWGMGKHMYVKLWIYLFFRCSQNFSGLDGRQGWSILRCQLSIGFPDCQLHFRHGIWLRGARWGQWTRGSHTPGMNESEM